MPTILPFGLSPIGTGVPTIPGAALPACVIAAEQIDPATGDIASLIKSADVIDDQVQIAMTALRGSGPAIAAVGHRFRDITKLTDNAVVLLEGHARDALALLVERGDIVIKSIVPVVDSPHTYAEVTVNYLNKRAIGDRTRQHVVRVEASNQ